MIGMKQNGSMCQFLPSPLNPAHSNRSIKTLSDIVMASAMVGFTKNCTMNLAVRHDNPPI